MSDDREHKPLDYQPPEPPPHDKVNWTAVAIGVAAMVALMCIAYYWYFIRPIGQRYGLWIPF